MGVLVVRPKVVMIQKLPAINRAHDLITSVQDVLTFLLSWIVLATISIIVSGKLLALRIPLGFAADVDFFKIPLGIFKVHARGDEVSLGLISFIFSLAACISFGGSPAYVAFRSHSGIDVGQWNSLCIIASFLSLLVAVLICIIGAFIRAEPVISNAERDEVLRRLNRGHDGNS